MEDFFVANGLADFKHVLGVALLIVLYFMPGLSAEANFEDASPLNAKPSFKKNFQGLNADRDRKDLNLCEETSALTERRQARNARISDDRPDVRIRIEAAPVVLGSASGG